MTAVHPTASSHPTRAQLLTLAVAAPVVHLAMMIPGYSDNGGFQTTEWLVVLAISLVVSLGLFLFVVPHAGAVAGVVLAVLAVVSVLAFWGGVTLPLAAAAAAIGWRTRTGERRRLATVTLVLAALSVVALVGIIISDAMSS